LAKKLGGSGLLEGLGGAMICIVVGTAAIFGLTQALRNVHYDQVTSSRHRLLDQRFRW
jgi:hypothetical protein